MTETTCDPTDAPDGTERGDGAPPKRLGLLVLCLLASHGAAVPGILSMNDAATAWYGTLDKPPVTPPGWVFGPVWTVLYTLMGISLWLLIRYGATRPGRTAAVIAFATQLLLNAVWTPVFFGANSIVGGLAVLLALLAALATTIVLFARIHARAAWLLAPYAAWGSFALLLNAWLWTIN